MSKRKHDFLDSWDRKEERFLDPRNRKERTMHLETLHLDDQKTSKLKFLMLLNLENNHFDDN